MFVSSIFMPSRNKSSNTRGWKNSVRGGQIKTASIAVLCVSYYHQNRDHRALQKTWRGGWRLEARLFTTANWAACAFRCFRCFCPVKGKLRIWNEYDTNMAIFVRIRIWKYSRIWPYSNITALQGAHGDTREVLPNVMWMQLKLSVSWFFFNSRLLPHCIYRLI